MPNGKMPSWEEWDGQLTEEQRKYSLYKILQDVMARLETCPTRMKECHERFEKIERRKRFDTTVSGAMGFVGGVAVWLGKKLAGY